VVEALFCKQVVRGFETQMGERICPIYPILPATQVPGNYSASNQNDYLKKKNHVSGEESATDDVGSSAYHNFRGFHGLLR
jgi:hypothetical protein